MEKHYAVHKSGLRIWAPDYWVCIKVHLPGGADWEPSKAERRLIYSALIRMKRIEAERRARKIQKHVDEALSHLGE